jgi:hypothetical protein
MAYAMRDYAEIEGDNPSLVVAFANLLQKYGRDIDPVVLSRILTQEGPEIDLWSLPEYVDPIKNAQVKEHETEWPPNSNSIVCVERYDEALGMTVPHYCAVADHNGHVIIDSWDGMIKSANVYSPIKGWAIYTDDKHADIIVPDPEVHGVWEPERTYVWVQHDNIWEVARRLNLGVTGQELLEHNGYEDDSEIKPGAELHLPYPRKLREERAIRYEVLPEPMTMHVNTKAGARKWSFGNIKKWSDFSGTGYYPLGASITVVAIAHVPVGEKDEAAYYMDAHALGDYKDTDKVSFTIGYAWSELSPGDYEKPPSPPPPVAEQRIAQQQAVVEEVPVEPTPGPNTYKASFKPLNEERKAELFIVDADVLLVHEMDGRRPSKTFYRKDAFYIVGTFEKDGVLYGRPGKDMDQTVASSYWWGVPMDSVMLEDELFNYRVDFPTRKATGRLSQREKVWDVINRTKGHYTRFVIKIKQK